MPLTLQKKQINPRDDSSSFHMTLWQFKVKSCHDVFCRDEFLSTTNFMTHQNIKFRFVCQHQNWSVWIWRRKKVVQFKNISFIFKNEEFLLWIKKKKRNKFFGQIFIFVLYDIQTFGYELELPWRKSDILKVFLKCRRKSLHEGFSNFSEWCED